MIFSSTLAAIDIADDTLFIIFASFHYAEIFAIERCLRLADIFFQR
jgi:hypothetical protein